MTTDVTPPQIEIRSLVLSGTDLATYQATVLAEAQMRLATRERGVAMAEAELVLAERGIDAAMPTARLRRPRARRRRRRTAAGRKSR